MELNTQQQQQHIEKIEHIKIMIPGFKTIIKKKNTYQ